MGDIQSDVPEEIKFLATIGFVSMQWALFEHSVLYIIYTLETITKERSDIIYGGLDWRQRLNMAINLADFHKLPPPLRRRLRDLRSEVGAKKLSDKRNTAIHGVHRYGETYGEFVLTMPRLAMPHKYTTMTARDLHSLGHEIHDLSQTANSIMNEIVEWRLGEHSNKNSSDSIAVRGAVGRVKVAQGVYARMEHFFRNLRL